MQGGGRREGGREREGPPPVTWGQPPLPCTSPGPPPPHIYQRLRGRQGSCPHHWHRPRQLSAPQTASASTHAHTFTNQQQQWRQTRLVLKAIDGTSTTTRPPSPSHSLAVPSQRDPRCMQTIRVLTQCFGTGDKAPHGLDNTGLLVWAAPRAHDRRRNLPRQPTKHTVSTRSTPYCVHVPLFLAA